MQILTQNFVCIIDIPCLLMLNLSLAIKSNEKLKTQIQLLTRALHYSWLFSVPHAITIFIMSPL